MTEIKHTITVKNKKYSYTLESKGKDKTLVRCDGAKVDQVFLNEDVPALLIDLPNLIVAEQEYSAAQNSVVHFRLKAEEKMRLEKNAIKSGFSSVSAYLRNLALGA